MLNLAKSRKVVGSYSYRIQKPVLKTFFRSDLILSLIYLKIELGPTQHVFLRTGFGTICYLHTNDGATI